MVFSPPTSPAPPPPASARARRWGRWSGSPERSCHRAWPSSGPNSPISSNWRATADGWYFRWRSSWPSSSWPRSTTVGRCRQRSCSRCHSVFLGAILPAWLTGGDNNLLTQIGLVVLIGLAAKNAILIVEFARTREDEGRSAIDAALEACRLRLRPILMTSISFIAGVLPLVLATGAGAEMRQAMGSAVFAGMIGVTVFGLLFTPILYVLVRRGWNLEAVQAGSSSVVQCLSQPNAQGMAHTAWQAAWYLRTRLGSGRPRVAPLPHGVT